MCDLNLVKFSYLFLLDDFFSQLVQRNDSPRFRYMQNVRNIIDPTMFSQGPMAPVMPLNVNGMPVVPTEAARSPSLPISMLASALASASPENQRVV